MKMVTYRPDVALPLKKEYNKTNKRNDVSPNPATTCVYFKIFDDRPIQFPNFQQPEEITLFNSQTNKGIEQ